MANTVTTEGHFIEVSAMDSDYDFGEFSRISSIQFNPGAAGDTLVVKNGSATGPKMFYAVCTGTDDQRIIYYFGTRCRPYIDYSECTLSVGHSVIINLWPSSR